MFNDFLLPILLIYIINMDLQKWIIHKNHCQTLFISVENNHKISLEEKSALNECNRFSILKESQFIE